MLITAPCQVGMGAHLSIRLVLLDGTWTLGNGIDCLHDLGVIKAGHQLPIAHHLLHALRSRLQIICRCKYDPFMLKQADGQISIVDIMWTLWTFLWLLD